MSRKWRRGLLCLILSVVLVATSIPEMAYAIDVSDNDTGEIGPMGDVSENDSEPLFRGFESSEKDTDEIEIRIENNSDDPDVTATYRCITGDRNDGVWRWPLPRENKRVEDWAGCICTGTDCGFHCGRNDLHATCRATTHVGPLGHNGMDIAAANDTAVFASAPGTVVYRGDSAQGRGLHIIIRHEGGNGWYYYSYYQHLSDCTSYVSVGSDVSAGQQIGRSGDTGSPGQFHLHFGVVLTKGQLINNENDLVAYGDNWITGVENRNGRIVVNPKNYDFIYWPYEPSSTLAGHSGSITYTDDSNAVSIGTPDMKTPKYTLDVNGYLDNYPDILEGTTLNNIATFDVYLNGTLDSKYNDVSDFCEGLEEGTTYEIKDIKPKSGINYVRPLVGSLSGKVSKDGTNIWLYFSSRKIALDFQGGELTDTEYFSSGLKV